MSRLALCMLALGSLLQATCAVPPVRGKPPTDSNINCGKTVTKTLDITWQVGNPNGNARPMTFVNGQFPGPDLVFDENDWVEITVNNHMPSNTSIHWHGLEMPGTPWSDGMPGLSQQPIEPGQSYIYKFRAYPAGTYWYHSHSRMDMLDGLYGAIFIRHNRASPAPWSLISKKPSDIVPMAAAASDPTLVVLSEWTNFTSKEYLQAEEVSELDIFCVDSLLINGKGSLYCPPYDQIAAMMDPGIAFVLLPGVVNDKGCLPFVTLTEGPFLPGKPELIPPGLQEGCVPANGSMSVIEVDARANNGWVSLNIAMASTLRIGLFSIDRHELWLYEVDGNYVEPVKSQVMTVYPGQRLAFMVKLDQTPADYTIRFADNGAGQIASGYAVLKYKGGHPLKNYTVGYTLPLDQKDGYTLYGGLVASNTTTVFDTLDPTPPYPPDPPAVPKKEGDELFLLTMGRHEGAWKWTMRGKEVYAADRDAYTPLLYYPNSTDALDEELVIRTKNGSWVDIILQVGALPGETLEIGHAIHKHGTKFFVIGKGLGVWNYTSVAAAIEDQPESFNIENPNLRDTAITEFVGAMWVAIRYQSKNPGFWLLHCHVETHLAGGMGIAIMDGYDAWPTIPPEYALGQHGFPVHGGHNGFTAPCQSHLY